jgi:UDP-N-acetylglucosamine 1-carboxyvinyltransferase
MPHSLIINGGIPLHGRVCISGAKNSALPIIAASMLVDDVDLNNVPDLLDVNNLLKLTQSLGSNYRFFDNQLSSDNTGLSQCDIPPFANQLRGSLLLAGPIVGRRGVFRSQMPGGCNFGGDRGVNFHLDAFREMGAKSIESSGYITIDGRQGLHGANINLPFPSVGATENVMIAACVADGKTTITNAAKEPEIVDLANFIVAAGGDIIGAGSSEVTINGVNRDSLNTSVHYSIISDRIEVGTFISAAIITNGDLFLDGARLNHLGSYCDSLTNMGIELKDRGNGIYVECPSSISAVDIITGPYPSFSTDLQPIIAPVLAYANGLSTITDTIYSSRFRYADELQKLGITLSIKDDHLKIQGRQKFSGGKANACDIRCGASLVIAGLAAEGTTEIGSINYIDRGYERIVEKLKCVGSDICRVE